jgi:hypothetical protein
LSDVTGSVPDPDRGPAKVGRALRTSSRYVTAKMRSAFWSRGAGFRHLAQSHAGSVAGDTLVAMALAGTLFFTVPSTEARENVALYLLVTLAPFAVLGPLLGRIYERFPAAYRGGLVLSSALRAGIALLMVALIDSLVLFPLAFLLLMLSRFHGISRSSVLPVVLDEPGELVAANAHLARLGVLGSAVPIPLGALGLVLDLPWIPLLVAVAAYLWSAQTARSLPSLEPVGGMEAPGPGRRRWIVPRPVRLARFATAAVRFLNGFLLLLMAFAFRDAEAGFLDFGFLLGAGGLGFLAAAMLAPVLDRRIPEEPMVVIGLAVEAAAAFIAAQVFGLPAAAALAGAAGLAWGTAKFGFDGLLQATVPSAHRGRAFTNSETMFQIAWVLGAIIPVFPAIPVEAGLAAAGVAALIIQVVYISATLIPIAEERRRRTDSQLREPRELPARSVAPGPDEGPDLLDLF